MTLKLNQVLAIEKGVKQRVCATMSDLNKVVQNQGLFNGFSKAYAPLAEDGLKQPPQSQKVAYEAPKVLEQVRKSLIDLFDVSATKDWGNQSAYADVVVDGRTIIKSCPATYMLFLIKQLTDLRTLVSNLTELDAKDEWRSDPATGLYRTEPTQTYTTQKVQEGLIIAPATDKFPAQAQMITKDVIVGTWTTVKLSGSIPPPEKKKILDRIQSLLDAVQVALEEANSTVVERRQVGDAVLSFVFGG